MLAKVCGGLRELHQNVYVDYGSAFNTITPDVLVWNLSDLVVMSAIWIRLLDWSAAGVESWSALLLYSDTQLVLASLRAVY